MVRAEDTAKVKLENRDVFPSTHKRLPTISRDGQSLATYQWSHVDKHGELVTVSIRLEESGSGAILHGYFGSTRSRMGIVSEAERISQMEMRTCGKAPRTCRLSYSSSSNRRICASSSTGTSRYPLLHLTPETSPSTFDITYSYAMPASPSRNHGTDAIVSSMFDPDPWYPRAP